MADQTRRPKKIGTRSTKRGTETPAEEFLDPITRKLKQAYQHTVDEDVPQKFSDLLAKLKSKQTNGDNEA